MFKIKEIDLGDQIETIGYYQDVIDGMQEKKNIISNNPKLKYEVTEEQKQERNKESSIRRSKTKIRRIAQRYDMKYMWTLTFSKKEVKTSNKVNGKESVYDTGEYEDVWRLWKSFLKRCKDHGVEFDYIVTVEVQEKRLEQHGEKVYHFHFITNKQMPVNMKHARKQGLKTCIADLWGHGYVYVTKKKSKKKLVHLYIVKYLAKLIDEMGSGKQRYRAKQGMVLPITETIYPDHTSFFIDYGEESVTNSSYSIMGDTLEIFWKIKDKEILT